ncbi:MAG TPA: HAMP domain-containing sensor histidine kinase [Acidimicrobiales bacterium]|jgi:two-component system sensor histidine kinase BaeS|nr:HAMP domain-containing sensor histidine kinase [Acidimicrobiales bacterium]
MRRRITVAILLLTAATLVVTFVGSFYFVRRAAITTAQRELAGQAAATAHAVSINPDITRAALQRQLNLIAAAGAFTGINVVALYPDGTIRRRLPSGITANQIDIPLLQQGKQVSGHTAGLLAYSAVPTPLDRAKGYLPVLVITRQIHNTVSGLRYFLIVGAIVLLIAALVAAGLARRLTRPLVAAVQTTRRIASGDLDATVPIANRDDPEFAQLAEAINAMGANLVRARDQERQFILSVSHELRTPLTSIRGYADAIIDRAADDPHGAAAVISAEAGRLERLVQDLLDLARLDADRFSLEVRAVDGAAVAAQVAEGFRPRAADVGLDLVVAPGSERPLWVEADPDRLGQIVANLVENASSFARHRIDIGTGRVDGEAVVWVADDGPGIPPDQVTRVFERHFVSDRVSGRRVGSGLGLAIVSELSAAMGATVRAESPISDGRGTRMVVGLRPAPMPAEHPAPRLPPGATTAIAPGSAPPTALPPAVPPLPTPPAAAVPEAGVVTPAPEDGATLSGRPSPE